MNILVLVFFVSEKFGSTCRDTHHYPLPSPRCPYNDKVLPRDCNKLGHMILINADGGAKQHTDIGHKGHTIDILMQCFCRAVMKNCNDPSFVMDAWRQKLCRTNREWIDWRNICLHDLFSTHTICTCHLPRKRQKNPCKWQKKLKKHMRKLFLSIYPKVKMMIMEGNVYFGQKSHVKLCV